MWGLLPCGPKKLDMRMRKPTGTYGAYQGRDSPARQDSIQLQFKGLRYVKNVMLNVYPLHTNT